MRAVWSILLSIVIGVVSFVFYWLFSVSAASAYYEHFLKATADGSYGDGYAMTWGFLFGPVLAALCTAFTIVFLLRKSFKVRSVYVVITILLNVLLVYLVSKFHL